MVVLHGGRDQHVQRRNVLAAVQSVALAMQECLKRSANRNDWIKFVGKLATMQQTCEHNSTRYNAHTYPCAMPTVGNSTRCTYPCAMPTVGNSTRCNAPCVQCLWGKMNVFPFECGIYPRALSVCQRQGRKFLFKIQCR